MEESKAAMEEKTLAGMKWPAMKEAVPDMKGIQSSLEEGLPALKEIEQL